FLHAETGERDGWRIPGFSYLPDQVDAGAIGQTEIAEIKIEFLSPDGFERGGDIWCDLCREAAVFQQSRQGARGVDVIFHEKQPHFVLRFPRRTGRLTTVRGRVDRGKCNGKR